MMITLPPGQGSKKNFERHGTGVKEGGPSRGDGKSAERFEGKRVAQRCQEKVCAFY
jgi:hypothetical protein